MEKNVFEIPDYNRSANSQEKIELTNDLLKAEMEIKDGHILPHKKAMKKIMDAINRH